MLHKPPLIAKNEISYFLNGSQYGFEASMLSFVLKPPFYYNIGGQSPETQHRISLVQFLQAVTTDKKVGNLSRKDLNQHRQNKSNLKTYTISTDGKAKWIRFGKLSESDRDRLTSYFNLKGIPFKIEKVLYRKDHEEYYVWVFLVPVHAKRAKNFAKYTLKLLGIDCEVLPNLIAVNIRSQNEIKMPLSKESSILVDETYMNEFDTMEAIEYIDLNNVDLEEYGSQIVQMLGSYDKGICNREVYQSKELLDSIDEEDVEQEIDSV
jgi:hypothetical protein